MANTIDFSTLAIGALIGIGCRKQLKAAGRVAASTVASLAGVAATAAQQIANETEKSQQQSPEERAASEWMQHMDQQIQGTNGQNPNGH